MATAERPKRKVKRYFQEGGEKEPAQDGPEAKNKRGETMKRFQKDGDKKVMRGKIVGKPGSNPRPWRNDHQERRVFSGKSDPFPGAARVPANRLSKYERARKAQTKMQTFPAVAKILEREESKVESAVTQAAIHDMLLPEEDGFLQADKGELTSTITQEDITDEVDITSASKHFHLNLNQFGPYRVNYTRNGRHLLVAGQRGHIAAMDWHTKKLNCEMNVMETVNDARWLHTSTMFAVAQKKWLYIYDGIGVELHCIKKFNDVLRMEFLPYHFLLATCSSTSFLQYLDISVGKEIAATRVKAGRLNVMCQNPYNAVIHLGHHNGTVSLWSPTVKEPLVKMLCHSGAIRALSIDKSGMYMASSGLDRKLTIFDLRTYKPVTSCGIPLGAGTLCHSQKGLLAVGTGNIVQVYKDTHITNPHTPYLCLPVKAPIHGLQFCPYEDILGIGHGGGFTSMIVPGAGVANFDGLECNPYETKKQRREWEVKALLEKIQPELITLDPTKLVEVDTISMQQKRSEQAKRLGYDPYETVKFVPRNRGKGRSSTGNILNRKAKVADVQKKVEIRKSLQEREKTAPRSQTQEGLQVHRTTLDRFKK